MSSSRFCQHCNIQLPEESLEGKCTSCGSAYSFVNDLKTPQATETRRTGEDDFVVGSDPDVTGEHVPSTIRDDRTAVVLKSQFPNILSHTDFEFVGCGGMGTVYRAIQRPTDRIVAVKVVSHFAAGSRMRDRFMNEVRAHAKINHPGIVPIYEVGECSHGPYFTMEYHPNGTLSDRLKKRVIDDHEAAQIVVEAADAVHAAHLQGIIHRDIKPSNILFSSEGRVKVTDFGLAKHATSEDITQTGFVIGTLTYMSPEQACGDASKVTKSSDVYCLGSTLFQLVTRETVRRKASIQDSIPRIVNDPTPSPMKFRPDLCPVLDAIILKSTAHRPEDRYETAEALANDLRKWEAGEPTEAKPLTRSQKIRRRLHRNRVALAVLIMLPFLIAAATVVKRESEPKRQIERALARGEKVTLVGETGLPKWHVWDMGNAELSTTISGDDAASHQTQVVSLLRLLDDPMTDSYRVSFDIRHCSKWDNSGSYVGIYFGYTNGVTAGKVPFSHFIAINFSDVWENAELLKPDVAANHGVKVKDFIIYQENENYSSKVCPVSYSEPNALFFTPRNNVNIGNCWRTIVLDVTPNGVLVSWIPDKNAPIQTAYVTKTHLDEFVYVSRFARTTNAGEKMIPEYWSPRRPIGIYSVSAAVAYRNVVIESLKND